MHVCACVCVVWIMYFPIMIPAYKRFGATISWTRLRMHTILILNAMRTDQLRWAEPARREAVQRERERVEGMLPSRTSARLSQFRLAMDKVFVASIRSVFVSAPKVSLVFSNCYFTFEISSALGRYPTTKTLPHIYGSCCCCCRCCKVRGIYLLTPRKTTPEERNKKRTEPVTETETKTESTWIVRDCDIFDLDTCQIILFYVCELEQAASIAQQSRWRNIGGKVVKSSEY